MSDSNQDMNLRMALLNIDLLNEEKRGANAGLGEHLEEAIDFYRNQVEALLRDNDEYATSEDYMEVK